MAQFIIHPVTGSSNIAAAGFDEDTGIAKVQYLKTGQIYKFQISPVIWEGYQKAASKGSYVREHFGKGERIPA